MLLFVVFVRFLLWCAPDSCERWCDNDVVVTETCDVAADCVNSLLELVDGAFEFDDVFVAKRLNINQDNGVLGAEGIKDLLGVVKISEIEWAYDYFCVARSFWSLVELDVVGLFTVIKGVVVTAGKALLDGFDELLHGCIL